MCLPFSMVETSVRRQRLSVMPRPLLNGLLLILLRTDNRLQRPSALPLLNGRAFIWFRMIIVYNGCPFGHDSVSRCDKLRWEFFSPAFNVPLWRLMLNARTHFIGVGNLRTLRFFAVNTLFPLQVLNRGQPLQCVCSSRSQPLQQASIV